MSAAVIIARLRDRDLYDLCETVARRHRQPMEAICDPSIRIAEVCTARHAVWVKVYDWLGGKLSATARLFGVNHASVYYAVCHAPAGDIVRVLLASFESDHNAYHFLWVSGRVNPFGVFDRVQDSITWFPTHELARAVFAECCAQAGDPTPPRRPRAPPDIPPRSHIASGGVSP